MKDNIYSLLNEMDHRADCSENFEADRTDVKKWKASFAARSGKKTLGGWKNYAAAAAGVLLLAGAAGPGRQVVYGGVKSVVFSISQMLGIEKDLSPYRTVVGKTITKKGMAVTLNEVILDEESMVVTYTTTSDGPCTTPEEESEHLRLAAVFINGKQMSVGASGEMQKADDYNMVTCETIELPDMDLSKEMEFEIKFDDFSESFRFTASGEALKAETKEVTLNEIYLLPDQTQLTFTKYTSNSIGQRIYFETTSKEFRYRIELKGTDDLGNEVEFELRHFGDGQGRMQVNTIQNGYIREEASLLTLTPYAVEMPKESGREDGEAVAMASAENAGTNGTREDSVGQAFTIKLK